MTKKPFTPPCRTGCACTQTEVFAAPADTPAAPASPATVFDWDAHDFLVIGDSGGKDSGALVHEVCTQADKAGQLDKVRVLHCDLGRTEQGHLVEWPGALEVARGHAERRPVRRAPQLAVAVAVGPDPGSRPMARALWQVLHE